MTEVNVIPVFENYKDFYNEIVLPYQKTNPTHIRLDGKILGSSRKVAAYFRYAGRKWKIDSDTHISRLKLAYETFEKSDEPFFIKHTRDKKGSCLLISGQPIRDKKFYVYEVAG
jgi:hypothetical protein